MYLCSVTEEIIAFINVSNTLNVWQNSLCTPSKPFLCIDSMHSILYAWLSKQHRELSLPNIYLTYIIDTVWWLIIQAMSVCILTYFRVSGLRVHHSLSIVYQRNSVSSNNTIYWIFLSTFKGFISLCMSQCVCQNKM